MRMLRVFGLALAIALLVLGSIAQAQENSLPRDPVTLPPGTDSPVEQTVVPVDPLPVLDVSATPDPLEFFFFFRHLASLDAAADKAVAEGNPDASEWKSVIQREAGLTDEEGAILKEVAYACNQALSEPTPSTGQPPGRMETVRAAVEELR